MAEVFEQLYRYRVYRQRLTTQRSAQIQVTKFLTDLIIEEDSEDTLLIIYYAGNATPDTDGRLLLEGSRKSRSRGERELNLGTIVWEHSESLIHGCLSDVLLIFDCCCAGAVARDHRGGMFTSRIFEFLGATGSDGTTPVPGPDSFTSALIWALSGLSSREGGFTTSQLQRMIREAPNLPKNQVPVLLDRSPGSVKRLMLAPLQARSSANAREDAPEDVKFTLSEVDMNRSVEADEEPSEQWSLNLQLLMQDLPTPDAITKIAAGFRNLMTSGDIVVQRIEWKGLSLVRSKGLSTPEVKSPAMLGVAQLMALRWQNRVLKKKVNSLSLLSRLLPVPLNPDRERPMPESEPIVLDRNRKPVSTGPSTGLGDQVYTQRVSRLLNFMSNHLFLVSTVSTIAFTMGGFSVPWILT